MSRFHSPKQPLLRRTLLRGAGVSLALPFLEAMTGSLCFGAERRAAAAAPLRLVFLYVPNGVNVDAWRPLPAAGEELALSQTLAPLSPIKEEVSVLARLICDKARSNGDGPGDHARASGAFLTCTQPKKGEGLVKVGVSVDQIAARQLGRETPFASLALGGEEPRRSGQCDSGYSCAYSSHLSWDREDRPVAKETDPQRLFDQLFRGGLDPARASESAEQALHKAKILDQVRGDARALARTLAPEDRQSLERYLEDIAVLERRLSMRASQRVEEVPDSARPLEAPESFEERLDLLFELLVLALATDQTRVATFLLANEGSNQSFPSLAIASGHHSLSHHGGDPENLRQIALIDKFYVERAARFLLALFERKEGERSLLDQSAVVYGSAIADGNAHAHHNLPLFLAGRLGGALHPGRHITVAEKGLPLANLFERLLREVGAPQELFGDSTGVLEGI